MIKNGKNKLDSLTRISWQETTDLNETVTFLDNNPVKKIHSYDCVSNLFKVIPYTIVNIKTELLKSSSSDELYMTVKEVSKVSGVTADAVRKYFKEYKAMIKKGLGGRPAKLKDVEHVNHNLVELTSAKKYISNHITRELGRLGRLNSSQFRKVD
tara:strand:+ start:87 stop:551 length:465 start_codon:yes stop_codon:yes gene_type:complete